MYVHSRTLIMLLGQRTSKKISGGHKHVPIGFLERNNNLHSGSGACGGTGGGDAEGGVDGGSGGGGGVGGDSGRETNYSVVSCLVPRASHRRRIERLQS